MPTEKLEPYATLSSSGVQAAGAGQNFRPMEPFQPTRC